ncbi:MAG: protein of unknown function DUF28 [Candidatus Magasanikbacteria bacterium]|nr:protein of unknown function DUF28 [Candidatus Magasanikbacteria bacterium]
MARHSKWANIQTRKNAVDKKRAVIFTKLARAITVATKEGGADISTNFKLATAIDQAHAANVPGDNVERAIQKGSGGVDGAQLDAVLFEAYGPSGVAFLIEALTDNNNRTAAEIRHLLSKHGGTLAGPGAVQWMFERVGIVRISMDEFVKKSLDEIELILIDAGAQDIISEDNGLTVVTTVAGLKIVLEAVMKLGIAAEYSGIEWRPKETVKVEDAVALEKLEVLYDALENHDDVQNVWSNEA